LKIESLTLIFLTLIFLIFPFFPRFVTHIYVAHPFPDDITILLAPRYL
jgi:hypothetical protein